MNLTSLQPFLYTALGWCWHDSTLIEGEDGIFRLGCHSDNPRTFIDALLSQMTQEQAGDFIQEYMLNLTAREAGEAWKETLTSRYNNPMMPLVAECARRIVADEYCQGYLTALENDARKGVNDYAR